MGEAWVTLATTDRYALGALVVAGSLRDAGTTRSKVVMVTDGVSPRMRTALSSLYDLIFDVTSMDSGDAAHLALLQRPDLGVTFTKLHCWRLTQFSKCVFLDADTIVLRNCDELFNREEFSAAPDAGWPDCFNSGVFVFKPSLQTFNDLVQLAETEGSFDGGDQGLLNSFFSDWGTKDIAKHLSFAYNMTATAMYTYLPALKRFGGSIKILHFIGRNKPWMATLTSNGEPCASPGEEASLQHLKKWWLVFNSHARDLLDGGAEMPLPQLMQQMSLPSGGGSQPSGPGPQQQDSGAAAAVPADQRETWEVGHPDFMGTAAFDNILKRIETTLSTPCMSQCGSMNDLRYISLPDVSDVSHYIDSHHRDHSHQHRHDGNYYKSHEYDSLHFNHHHHGHHQHQHHEEDPGEQHHKQHYDHHGRQDSHHQHHHHHGHHGHHEQQHHGHHHDHHGHHHDHHGHHNDQHHNQHHEQHHPHQDWHHHQETPGFRSRRNSNPIHLDGFISTEPTPEENRNCWESGKPDFKNWNAFDTIKAKLDSMIPAAYDHEELRHQEGQQGEYRDHRVEHQRPPVDQMQQTEEADTYRGDEASYDYTLWKLKHDLGEPAGLAAARERAQQGPREEVQEESYSRTSVTPVSAALAPPTPNDDIPRNSTTGPTLRNAHQSCPSCGHKVPKEKKPAMVSAAAQTHITEWSSTSTQTKELPAPVRMVPFERMSNSSGYGSSVKRKKSKTGMAATGQRSSSRAACV